MNKIPEQVLSRIRNDLWRQADEVSWNGLPDADKAAFYERWQHDTKIGGVLSNYADIRNVRVYIKDTIMKPYARERVKDPMPILRLLGLPEDSTFRGATFIKPHGRILSDGKTVSWGRAKDWKSILVATAERAFRATKCVPYAAVLITPSGKLLQPGERALVMHLGHCLGIQKIAWGQEVADIGHHKTPKK